MYPSTPFASATDLTTLRAYHWRSWILCLAILILLPPLIWLAWQSGWLWSAAILALLWLATVPCLRREYTEITPDHITYRSSYFGTFRMAWGHVQAVQRDRRSALVLIGNGRRLYMSGPLWWGGASGAQAEARLNAVIAARNLPIQPPGTVLKLFRNTKIADVFGRPVTLTAPTPEDIAAEQADLDKPWRGMATELRTAVQEGIADARAEQQAKAKAAGTALNEDELPEPPGPVLVLRHASERRWQAILLLAVVGAVIVAVLGLPVIAEMLGDWVIQATIVLPLLVATFAHWLFRTYTYFTHHTIVRLSASGTERIRWADVTGIETTPDAARLSFVGSDNQRLTIPGPAHWGQQRSNGEALLAAECDQRGIAVTTNQWVAGSARTTLGKHDPNSWAQINPLKMGAAGAVMLALAGLFAVLAVRGALDDQRLIAQTASWQPVNATVVSGSIVELPRSRDTDYRAAIVYRYNVDGREYQDNTYQPGTIFETREQAAAIIGQYPAGTAITVRHNPADPAEAMMVAPVIEWPDRFILGFMSLLILGGVWCIVRALRPLQVPGASARSGLSAAG